MPQGGALDLELRDVTWREESDGLSASWSVFVHNRGSESFNILVHEVGAANAATRANKWVHPANDWDTEGRDIFDPDPQAFTVTRFSGGASTSVEPGLPTFCSWVRTDRILAVCRRPECSDVLWAQLTAAPDTAALEAVVGSLAVDMPMPD